MKYQINVNGNPINGANKRLVSLAHSSAAASAAGERTSMLPSPSRSYFNISASIRASHKNTAVRNNAYPATAVTRYKPTSAKTYFCLSWAWENQNSPARSKQAGSTKSTLVLDSQQLQRKPRVNDCTTRVANQAIFVLMVRMSWRRSSSRNCTCSIQGR